MKNLPRLIIFLFYLSPRAFCEHTPFEHKNEFLVKDDTENQSYLHTPKGKDASKPRMIIHIGPRKTGSTALQNFILQNLQMLNEAYNYYWPIKVTKSPQGLGDFAKHFVATRGRKFISKGAEMAEFLSECFKKNRNIIISSELFSYVPKSGVIFLKEMVKEFDVKIVYVYREILNLFVSNYNQKIKNLVTYDDFATHLITTYEDLKLEANNVLSVYEEIFGIQNIIIIDYYGTLAIGRDIPTSIYCSIIKDTCQSNEIINSVIKNTHQNTTLQELTVILLLFSRTNRCEFGTSHRAKGVHLIPTCLNGTSFEDYNWPSIHMKSPNIFYSLLPSSYQLDFMLREKYNKNIIYGNITANRIAAQNSPKTTSVVDRTAILHDEKWVDAMENLLFSCEQLGLCVKSS